MESTEDDVLTARLFFRAAFPVMKVPLAEDPGIAAAFRELVLTVQFLAMRNPDPLGCILRFDRGAFSAVEGISENPDIVFRFGSVRKLNDMLRGKAVLPSIRGWRRLPDIVKVFRLLLSLMLMMPTARPKDPVKKRLKVKMSLYMITTALSVYNKLGAESMRAWTEGQPDRIYQFEVEPYEPSGGIAAYLRVRGGNTKAGRGVFPHRRPFVHFRFNGVDGALRVLLKEVDFVSAVEKDCVRVDGSPEYSGQLNDLMAEIQSRMT